jgi:hypothetical protein
VVSVRLAVAYGGLCLAQASAVLLPGRALRLPALLGGRAWGLVLPGVLVAFVVGLSADPSLASRLAELAVVTPLLALAAFLVAEPRRRVLVAVVSAVVVVLGLCARHGVAGEAARVLAIACACGVLATLLAGVAPPNALRAGLVALVALDLILVVAGDVGTTSQALHQASAPGGLPRFQDATLGPATMGYGDLFGAAVLGALLTREHRPRRLAAAAVLVCALGFGLLLTVVTTLPATLPLLAGMAAGGQERRAM